MYREKKREPWRKTPRTTPLLMCMHSMLVHGYVCMHTGTHMYIYYTHTIIKWGKIVKKYPVLLTLTPNKITNSSLVTAHIQLIFKLFQLSPTFSKEVDLCKLGPQPTLCIWSLSHRGPLFPGHVGVLFFWWEERLLQHGSLFFPPGPD